MAFFLILEHPMLSIVLAAIVAGLFYVFWSEEVIERGSPTHELPCAGTDRPWQADSCSVVLSSPLPLAFHLQRPAQRACGSTANLLSDKGGEKSRTLTQYSH